MSIWIRNTAGHKDALLTMTLMAFVVVLWKVIVAGATFTLGTVVYSAGAIDGGIIGSLLTPLLGSYVFRRYTDAKFAAEADAIEARDDAEAASGTTTKTTVMQSQKETKVEVKP